MVYRNLGFSLFLIVLIFCRLDRLFFKENGSFCPKFILPRWAYCPKVATPEVEVDQILNQPFTYLTKGKQSFAFRSEDGKWVLKCFRLPKRARYFSKKGDFNSLSFLEKTFEGASLAQIELPKETGLLYAHLAPSSHLNKGVELIDKMGRHYIFKADSLPFVLQRYGEDFFSFFDTTNNKKKLILDTIALYSRCYEKGIIDQDPIWDKNFGILEGKPFVIDIGQLEKVSPLPNKREYLEAMTVSLREKLLRESPSLFEYYKKNLN